MKSDSVHIPAIAFFAVIVALPVIFYMRPSEPDLWRGPGSEPEVMSISDDDERMNEVMRQARETIDEFITAFRNKNSSQTNFSVKIGIRDGEETEFIWLKNISIRDSVFYGTVGNDPSMVSTVRFGDAVSVARDEIADWMYVENGRLVGGYTIREMRERLSPEERMQLDANLEFTFD